MESSRDDGQNWQKVDIHGESRYAERFTSAVTIPGGGWLATIEGFEYAGGGPFAWLVRSPDGVEWEVLLGPGVRGCPAHTSDTDSPSYEVSGPLRLGARWFVSFSCPAGSPGLQALFVGNRTARRFEVFESLSVPSKIDDPLSLPGKLLLPVRAKTGQLLRLVTVGV